MPKLEKGSQAAKDWAKKMRDARMSKKSVKGGVIGDDPFGLSKGGKKLSLTKPITPVPATPSPEIPDVDFKPIKTVSTKKTERKRKPKAQKTPLDPTMPDLSAYDKMSDDEIIKLLGKGIRGGMLSDEDRKRGLQMWILQNKQVQTREEYKDKDDEEIAEMDKKIKEYKRKFGNLTKAQHEAVAEKLRLPSKEPVSNSSSSSSSANVDEQLDELLNNITEDELREMIGKGIRGGYLQPGELPPSAGPIEYTENSYIVEPDDVIDGEGMCTCCKMCGGKLSLKKIGRAFSKLGQATTKINPVSLALENKKSRDAMIQSGQFTQDVALPTVTTAGLPLYYGAAGTAGMMLGGPVGSMAATKAADELYKEMVVRPGYDPQQRQKSKTVGVIAKKTGELGAKNLKQGASGKGMVGGALTQAEIEAVSAIVGIPVGALLSVYGIPYLMNFVNNMRRGMQVAPLPEQEQEEEMKEEPRIDIEMGGEGMRKKKSKLVIIN